MSATSPALSVSDPDPLSDQVGVSALRKASSRLLPLIALGYGASYIDRVNVSFASLQMNHDLHFSASMYGFGAGLFFLGYALCEVPSNLVLYRFGARRWLARIMLTWGLLAVGVMFVRTPRQFYVMRFLLGMAEAGYFPGVAFYLMQWFPDAARARAVSRFYIAVPLAAVVMGSLAGALLKLQGTFGLAGWQWLFLVEGLPPVLLSVIFLKYLPDSPTQAKWLTLEERVWLVTRLERDAPRDGHGDQVRRALLDKRVWQFGLLSVCFITCTYAYALSAPAILQKATALSITGVGFLVAGMYLLGVGSMLANAAHSDRAKERHLHVTIPLLTMAAGYFVGGLALSPVFTVLALAIAVLSSNSLGGVLWVIPATFLRGKSAAVGLAAITSVGILGGFIGPYWMGLMKDLTGSYQFGLKMLAVPCLTAAAIALIMRRDAVKSERPAE